MKKYWLLSAGIAALATPTYAHAQDDTTATADAAAQPADAATEPANDGEIVVTAQGRRQPLQDVPLAVTAVGGQSMQNSGATDIRALNQLAPSLLVSSTGTEANGSARIRGIGTVGDNPGLESSVAVFVDGVYRSRSGIGLNELGKIERIEVARGPQGTLFGRNASAGLIHVITARPEFEFGGEVEASYGNYDYMRGAVGLTGPIGEHVAFRHRCHLHPARGLLRRRQRLGRHRIPRQQSRPAVYPRANCCSSPMIRSRSGRSSIIRGAANPAAARSMSARSRPSTRPRARPAISRFGSPAPAARRTATESSTSWPASAASSRRAAIRSTASSRSPRAPPTKARPPIGAPRCISTGIWAARR